MRDQLTRPDGAPEPAKSPARSSRGCWTWVAVGCGVLLVVAVVGGFLAYQGIKGMLAEAAEEYTSDHAVELPAVDVAEDEATAVLDRVEHFARALRRDEAASPLVLTSEDLNVLVKRHPAWSELAGKLHVTIEGDRLKAQTSFPMDEFGSLFAGRYLNGTVLLRLGMTDGRLEVYADSVEVGGKPLPEQIVTALEQQNLADDANRNPEMVAMLDKLESIRVENGTLVITPR